MGPVERRFPPFAHSAVRLAGDELKVALRLWTGGDLSRKPSDVIGTAVHVTGVNLLFAGLLTALVGGGMLIFPPLAAFGTIALAIGLGTISIGLLLMLTGQLIRADTKVPLGGVY